ncbi:MAG: PQQ-like beta-propeller repeat protein, partial [Candidatus Omnitrophica bacterium]|nr:PQQ-like beta-propeller repeat protein [Candidatus Omnitrophota bacterium]
ILVDGRLFLVSDNGYAACLEAATGKVIWQERLEGEYSASPISSDHRVYFFSQDGLTTVVKSTGPFSRLAENRLDDGLMASPAVSNHALFLRTRTHLYRIEEEQSAH